VHDHSSVQSEPAFAGVVIAEPSHRDELMSSTLPQTIRSFTDEVEVASITEKLKLLTNLRLHIVVAWIDLAQPLFKGVDVINIKFSLPNKLDALHHFDKPAPGFTVGVTKKCRFLPLGEYGIF
jgi:hypothetical protein